MPNERRGRGGLDPNEAERIREEARARLDEIREDVQTAAGSLRQGAGWLSGNIMILMTGYADLVCAARAERPSEFLAYGYQSSGGFQSFAQLVEIQERFRERRAALPEEPRKAVETLIQLWFGAYETPGFRARLGDPSAED